MLIVIDDMVGERIAAGALEDRELQALRMLALGRKEGKLLLFGSRSAMRAIELYMVGPERAIFARVREKLGQLKGLVDSLRAVCIAKVAIGGPEVEVRDEQVCLVVPLDRFSDSASVQECGLLVEGLDDFRLYESVGRAAGRMLRVGNGYFSVECMHGGGSTVPEFYKQVQQEDRRFVLCIVDSDRRWPGGAVGSNARKVEHVDDPQLVRSGFIVLPVREVENLLSRDMVLLAGGADPGVLQGVERLGQLVEAGGDGVHACIDFKEAAVLEEYLRAGGEYQQYWLNVFRSSPGGCELRACISVDECELPGVCACRPWVGLGSQILKWSVNELAGMSPAETLALLCPTTRGWWADVGAVVFSWGCCGPAMRA